jgi:hypothetical protein
VSKFIDLTGKKFNRLTVICLYPRKKSGTFWRCKCDCGKETIVNGGSLKNNHIKSCGCLRLEISGKNFITHGMTNIPAYKIWQAMKTRCNNLHQPSYKNYGGRGIKICKRWNKFENFYKDMGDRPKDMTLERINNDKGYCKSNCIWTTRKEQMNNTRMNHYLEYNGLRLTISQWEDRLHFKRGTLKSRIIKYGYTTEQALTKKLWSR